MSGEFVERIAKEQPHEPYLNFQYKKTFPAYSYILPPKFQINQVNSTDLQFLSILHQYKEVTTPENFDKWIFTIGDKLKSTNAFKSYLISIDDITENQFQVNIQTQTKSFIPLFHELFKQNRGFYPHIQLNNTMGNGERIQLGYAINQQFSQLVWKTSLPIEDEKLKMKLIQKKSDYYLPVKSGSIKLKEYRQSSSKSKRCWSYKTYVKNGDYTSKIMQKRIFGLSCQYKFEYSNNKQSSVIIENIEKIGTQLELYPSSLNYGYRFYYSLNPTLNLFNLLKQDMILANSLSVSYSKNIKNRGVDIYGYKHMDQQDGFQIKNCAIMFFRTHRILQQFNIIPTVQLSTSIRPQIKSDFLGDKLKLSLSSGVVLPFGKQRSLFIQYNWLSFHGAKDYPLKFQFEFL